MGFEKLLHRKRLIVVCGLGGVGKTTLSAALALKAAQTGKKSLVITVDPAKRLAQALGLKIPCPEPKLVWKGKGALYACLLEAKETFDHLIHQYAPKDLRKTILNNKLYQQLSLMLAGTQEYMAMEKLYALSAGEKFDLLIVDTPPARHAIDFLKAPMKLSNMLNDSILRFLITPSVKVGVLGSKILETISHIAGGGILEDIAHLMHLSLQMLDGFTQRSQTIQKTLAGKESAFVLATAVTSATMSDCLNFRQELDRLGFSFEGILVNRMPPFFGRTEEVAKALEWGKRQKDPLWQQASLLLEKQQAVHTFSQAKLKPLVEEMPHYALVPEEPEGVSNFEDLKKLACYL